MTHEEIGRRIKTLRTAKNYSREIFAEKMGLSSKFVYEIEKGKKGFSADTLIKMSRELNVSCDYILGNDTQNMIDASYRSLYKHEMSQAAYAQKFLSMYKEMNGNKGEIK